SARLPAAEIEGAVIAQLRSLLRAPEAIVSTWTAARRAGEEIAEANVRDALIRFDSLWDELFPAEQARIVQLLVARIDVGLDDVRVRFRVDGIGSVVTEVAARQTRTERVAA
ncbi:site-specific recombinase, partial [Prosthecomicrobium hirschii]